MNLELFDIALRGASSGMMLVYIVLLCAGTAPRETKIAFTLMCLATACRLWSSLPPGFELSSDIDLVLKRLGATAMLFFTWFFIAIFVDRRRYFWLWMVSAGAVVLSLLLAPYFREVVGPLRIYVLVHAGLLIASIIVPKGDDLVEARRDARVWVGIVLALYVMVSAMTSTQMTAAVSALATFGQSVLFFFCVLIFGLWSLNFKSKTWINENQHRSADADASRDQKKAAQVVLMRRIEEAMAREIWRKEGLTVGALAQEVNAPEHQVRKGINQVLGHRNFSSFINQARVEAAKAQLSSPDLVGTSVQEIAYGVGFSSIGPFNRAFRDATGQAPSEFRAAALADS